ncbi:hypothetical protein [Salinibacterium sp. ZJ77]|uniref:hypothetical protein n=1 Tax=Salinibacterium sp. ZJ77 TaxID=2708337 RepID=UPI001423BA2B|nr:hypothetical protein [Salinibacterium sp. ZJ77]
MAGAPARVGRTALGFVRGLALCVTVTAAAIGATYVAAAAATGTIITFGPFSTVTSSLPGELIAVNAVAVLLWCLVIAAIAWILAELARAAARGVRFDRPLSRAAWALAIVLALGATVAQAVTNLSTASGVVYPDDADPWSTDASSLPVDWALEPWNMLMVNWPLLGLAIVLGVLAYIVRAGEHLQRDTEGLV